MTAPPITTPPAAAATRAPADAEGAARLLALQALALGDGPFEAAAAAVLDTLARQLACERASLGFVAAEGVRLAACSGGDADERRPLVRQIEQALAEAVQLRATVVFPLPPGAAAGLHEAHLELHRAVGGLSLCSLPVVAFGRVLGALLLERREGFDAATLRAATDAVLFVLPLLELMHRVEHGPRLLPALAAERGLPLDAPAAGPHAARRARRPLRLALAGAGAALLAAGLLPVQHEVVAAARLEGAAQRVIAAPSDGFVASAEVRPGARVQAGQLLLTLQTQELALERDRRAAELAQLDKQYREALARDEAAPIAQARERLAQAQAQWALAESELARSRVVAPFDGVVIEGDLEQAAGRPVQRGQPLLTLAPALQLRVVAEVDEADIGWVREGGTARVVFAAQPGEPVAFRVERVSPVATLAGGANVFEVEGALDAAAAAALRPGQRGVARLEVERRLLAERAWIGLQRQWQRWRWRLLG